MTPQKRIKELRTRQIWNGSSMYVKLNAVKGYWYYTVYLIAETNEKRLLKVGGEHGLTIQRKAVGEMFESSIDGEHLILRGKYNGEDPDELIVNAEKIVGKWQCGKQIRIPST